MRGPSASASTSRGAAMAAFKQDLLKNLLLGFRARDSFDAMSLLERTRAVKRSADVAMAAARGAAGGRARWPKAILNAAAAASSRSLGGGTCKVSNSTTCKRLAMRRRLVDTKRTRCYAAARRLVRRRTMALREVIPGGNAAAMDEASLLREAMDYVVHLRAQVDVLRRVSAAVHRSTYSFLRDSSQTQSMGES